MATNIHEINREQFFELLRAGLWSSFRPKILAHGVAVNWEEVYRLAEEQSVIGLTADGIDRSKSQVSDFSIPKELVLQFIGSSLQIEQQNKEMNAFVVDLIEKLREEDVYAILVKGQGIAQCYERPLWRSSGDLDLLLSDSNYEKAKNVLDKIADSAGRETAKNTKRQHQDYKISGWTVELHGTMHAKLCRKIDKEIDKTQREVFYGGKVRSWLNEGTHVFLPAPDEDVIFVFTHILQHLFLEGIGLRQICDWCRLLYTYKDSLNHKLLESRIQKMGLMSEWKALYNLASKYLGMPDYGEGLMVHDSRFDKKSKRLMDFIMEVGNFGHNREVELSNGFKRCTSLIWHRITDTMKLSFVFPVDAPKFLLNYAVDGVRGLVRW